MAKAKKKVLASKEPAVKKAKYVYYFGGAKAEGKAEMKGLLGGKGANLAEMVNIGLPVPRHPLTFAPNDLNHVE